MAITPEYARLLSADHDLRLDPPHGVPAVCDSLLRTVRRQLLDDVHVEVDEQLVLLSGSVQTWHEKQLAQEVIRLAAPTRRIRNGIRVASQYGD